ncbi:MAG: acyltransferase family protein [Azonexus sp.]
MEFRKNINALRAIAVLAVVLFHFKFPGFSGGYSGVDIFFVISGFLMTGIIQQGLKQGEMSLLGFYASRARRIVPGLLGLCLFLMIFGFVNLPVSEFRALANEVQKSVYFVSNFSLLKSGNYFDAPPSANWLLHTWSLSVEWQFYMIYPVLLLAFWKSFGIRRLGLAVIALAFLSFGGAVFFGKAFPVASFYLLPTRAWELLAGALAFLYPRKLGAISSTICEVVGLLLIAGGIVFFDETLSWPGWATLVPVIGAVLVIYGNTNSLFSRNSFLQWIGKISYSIYLWHWPLVVFLFLCGLLAVREVALACVAMSVFLGWVSYRFVETTGREFTSRWRRLLYYFVLVCLVSTISLGAVEVAKKIPEARFPFAIAQMPAENEHASQRECYENDFQAVDCKIGNGDIKAIIFGDSHAGSSEESVHANSDGATLLWFRGGCPMLRNYEMLDKKQEKVCRAFVAEKIEMLSGRYSGVPVIVFNRAGIYANPQEGALRVFFAGQGEPDEEVYEKQYVNEYVKTVCAIAENHPTFVVKPIPEMPFNIYIGLYLRSRFGMGGENITVPLEKYMVRHRLAFKAIESAQRACEIRVLDPVPYLCPDGACMGSKNGQPLYLDDNHLLPEGNKVLSEVFRMVFAVK